jgi:hypothetical protein
MRHVTGPFERPFLSYLVFGLPSYLFVGNEYSLNFFDQLSLVVSNFLIWGSVISPIVLLTRSDYSEIILGSSKQAEPDDPATVRFDERRWKLVAVLSMLIGTVVSVIKPVMRDRYFLPITPLFAIVYITSFYALFPRIPKRLRLLLPVLIWVPLWVPYYGYMLSTPETGTPAIVQQIIQRADRQKDLVVISWASISPAITFYLPQDVNVIVYPELKRTQFNRWEGMSERLRDPKRLHELFGIMEGTLKRGGKIWLIDWGHAIQTRDPDDESEMQTLQFQAADLRRQDQIRTWLAIHADVDATTVLAPGRDFSIYLTVYKPAKEPKPMPVFPRRAPDSTAQPGSEEPAPDRLR